MREMHFPYKATSLLNGDAKSPYWVHERYSTPLELSAFPNKVLKNRAPLVC